MAKTDIWMPLYIGDYLADTTRLTTEQHGAYLLLIMDYWRSGAPPDDDNVIQNITKMSPKNWQKIKRVVMRLFTLKEGLWTHSRIDKQLAEAAASQAKSEDKAKKAAEARWSKQQPAPAPSNAPSNAPGTPQALLEPCPLTSTTPLKTKSKTESALATRLPADWCPNESEENFCKAERPDLRVPEVAAKFRDHWIAQPGLKGRKTDWTATWRNWVRSEKQVRSSPAKPEKFDPTAYVNRNRITPKNERTIDFDQYGDPV